MNQKNAQTTKQCCIDTCNLGEKSQGAPTEVYSPEKKTNKKPSVAGN
jgi:hypothetical protein